LVCFKKIKYVKKYMKTLLFEPLQVGEILLSNRVVMAPLTRLRATVERVPTDIMVEYYTQRAFAGLIITEATVVSADAVGYPQSPGIWNDAQIAAWKKITDAVHAKNGKIVCQLWHVGRISHPTLLNGALPVSASAIQPKGHVSLTRPPKDYVAPRALEMAEIKQIVKNFAQAAKNAKLAGFDGVELHGANGYLLDQFLQDGTNKRTDEYGGSLENRLRFPLEVLDAVIAEWGAGRVGYHIAPRCDIHDMSDTNPTETFSRLMQELSKRKIAFVFSRSKQGEGGIDAQLKEIFGGVYIANQMLDKEKAEDLLQMQKADAVAFGVLMIANPDLVERFKQNAPLNKPNPNTFYPNPETFESHDFSAYAVGYLDYPFLSL
jgi:2,4-dienoyl-CoA reductase-like NADH-dependent reductase (Old Yellow Enzyme family)